MADLRRAGALSRGRRGDGGAGRGDIAAGRAPELVWLLEHPPLYTSGTSGKAADLLDPRFPVFASGRGGQLTYHGPGQRVAYVMLDLKARRPDVRAYVAGLEQWIIRTLAAFNVRGERREDRVGVWVKRPDKGAEALKTRWRPSACGCGAGSRSTASPSMWSPI
jgi:lipoate-protein ligase B